MFIDLVNNNVFIYRGVKMSYLLYEIPGSFSHEIDELDSHVADFMNNTISESDLKSKRVPFGIYEQRQKGTYMVRVRCAAGIITPTQLKRVAELSLIHASGILHVTTRQEIQIHDVAIENLVVILRDWFRSGFQRGAEAAIPCETLPLPGTPVLPQTKHSTLRPMRLP